MHVPAEEVPARSHPGQVMGAARLRLALAAVLAGGLSLTLVQAERGPRPAPVAGGAPVKVTCTFENPGYAGACVEWTTREGNVTPAAACGPILDCLNDARCVKTYCQSTSIRQGWTLKSAE
jgi:hypothetical protein